MTVAALSPSASYLENGVTLAFAAPFRFLDPTHLEVKRIAVDGTVTLLAYGVDYTVTGGSTDAGGTVTLITSTSGATLKIRRVTPRAQQTDYVTNDTFPAESHEAALDRQMLIDQEQDVKIDDTAKRALLWPEGEQAPAFPSPIEPGKFLVGTIYGRLAWADGLGADATLRSELAAPSGSNLAGFLQSGVNAVGRTVQSKLREITSVGDFATHAAAHAAALLAASVLSVPTAASSTLANKGAVSALHNGQAQVTLADGHKLGKQFSKATARPSALGVWDSADTAFDGDLRYSLTQHEHYITGTATLGTPTSGYLYTPEVAGYAAYLVNQSGYNNSTSGNSGRTSANYFFVKVDQLGGGDATALTVTSYIAGAGPVGATDWLAMPAAVALNGTFTLGGHARYANFIECDIQMGVFDAAGIGMVANITRNAGDTANGLKALANGFRAQSHGTYAVDAVMGASGLFKSVIDATTITLTSDKAFAIMQAGHRIYGGGVSTDNYKATSYGTHWLECSASGFWNVVYNNASCLQINNDAVALIVPPKLPQFTVLGLPSAITANRGKLAVVTDANATTRLSVVAGGGANIVMVFCNGSNWVIV